jgi:Inositol 1,3,4-trisphosphate 5/6-kinase ATP-grasp domain
MSFDDEEADCAVRNPPPLSHETMRDVQDLLRPIVVGYAFGPKKMSTMGMVMAEASKTRLVSTSLLLLPFEETMEENEDLSDNTDSHSIVEESGCLTREDLYAHDCYAEGDNPQNNKKTSTAQSFTSGLNEDPNNAIVFSLGCAGEPHSNGAYYSGGSTGLQNIVRYFRSSCSSIDDSESTGTCTASTVSQITVGTSATNNTNTTAGTTPCIVAPTSAAPIITTNMTPAQLAHNKNGSLPRHRHNFRVSFVPLDPDVPLEDQHGGKIDVILHKLTEDILCLSQLEGFSASLFESSELSASLSSLQLLPQQSSSLPSQLSNVTHHWTSAEQAAVQRVHNVWRFARDHQCCLVDDPLCVQTLMSRADIADTLHECLQGTRIGDWSVSTPRYAVVHDVSDTLPSHLSFPLIVKSLTAAGTKASHAMAVVLHASAWSKTLAKMAPCLVQEYVNHDATLYKVYVLGPHVSVHKRRSLPNLPATEHQVQRVEWVEFDSQRPYPRLSHFGFAPASSKGTAISSISNSISISSSSYKNADTAQNENHSTVPASTLSGSIMTVKDEDLQSLVPLMKQAFGLELFGFDVLRTSSSLDGDSRLLVVDVNYFPSYKEVPNFPALLAQYLTDRAIDFRKTRLNMS